MKNITDWIKQHQVTAFFIFTLTFTFGLGIPAMALINTIQEPLQMIGGILGIVAAFGPVLSGMTLTRITAPLKNQNNRKARWIMFLAVWIVAWIALAMWVKGGIPSENGPGLGPILVLTAPIALLPAYVVSSAFSRVGSLRSYLSTLVKPRGNIAWYLVAFFTFPIIHLLGNVFANLAAGRPLLANVAGATAGLIGIAVLEFIKVFFWSGGINEESGWRGFALPRLQSKLPPIVAGLIIWVVHTIWELLGDVFMDVFSARLYPKIFDHPA